MVQAGASASHNPPTSTGQRLRKGAPEPIEPGLGGWPGIGRLMVQAILTDDIPLILGTVTLTAILVVISNILVDIVQAFIDPRIRLS